MRLCRDTSKKIKHCFHHWVQMCNAQKSSDKVYKNPSSSFPEAAHDTANAALDHETLLCNRIRDSCLEGERGSGRDRRDIVSVRAQVRNNRTNNSQRLFAEVSFT